MADSEISPNRLPPEPAQRDDLVHAIRARVEPFKGVELETTPREPMREPINLGDLPE
jgi:hypothetical protein